MQFQVQGRNLGFMVKHCLYAKRDFGEKYTAFQIF